MSSTTPAADGGARRRRSPAWTVAAVLTSTMLAVFLISPILAEQLLYYPDPRDPGDPPSLAGVAGRSVSLEAADGVRLHAWWWEVDGDAPAVLFLHGNAGNIGGRVPTAEQMVSRGISTLHLDYRGYGRSEGQPREEGLRLDAAAALEWIAARAGGSERVVVHGRSLGAVVAVRLAADHPVAGLIVESGFTSLEEIAAAVYPFVPRILLRRLRGRYDALAAMERVRAPVLVIHGTADELIPVRMGEALYERAQGERAYLPVSGARHNDLPFVAGPAYFERISSFVREAAEGR